MSLKILGIETSFDETSCGIVNQDFQVLSNVIFKQEDIHALYGGVVPEVASRTHLEKMSWVCQESLKQAQLSFTDLDGIVFTQGPGLIGPLLVGSSFGYALALGLNLPYEGVCHLEGHLCSALLANPNLQPPFLCLLVSGGHTELVAVQNWKKYQVLGRTRDDAVGEAFDKSGKILGLGYPSGPQIAKWAQSGEGNRFPLPTGLQQRESLEFSFSGVKTAFLRLTQNKEPAWLQENLPHLCASLETNLVQTLTRKCKEALRQSGLGQLVLCGGVSANTFLRKSLFAMCSQLAVELTIPPLEFCTDNGAMIAAAGVMRAQTGGLSNSLQISPSLKFEDI